MATYSKNYKIPKKIKLSINNNNFINKLILLNDDFTASYIINIALENLQKKYIKNC